jgi:CRISPR-associated protein Cmr1
MRKLKTPLPESLAKTFNVDKHKDQLNEWIESNAFKDPKIITQTRRYKLITPLFGGGVEPGVNDELTPISGKAIRGHLRFWWRATSGVGTLIEMKKAEDAIWGTASTKNIKLPSAVTIEVIEIKKESTKQEPAFKNQTNRKGNLEPFPSKNTPQYAAFPLLPDKDERKKANWVSEKIWCDIEFTIRLKYPKEIRFEKEKGISEIIDVETEINSALWAWENFGGVGSRTRRGFGALHLLEIDNNIQELKTVDSFKKTIQIGLNGCLAEGTWHQDVPNLLRSPIAFTQRKSTCIEAWKDLISKLHSFRQSPRNQSKFKDESHWPEPDAIRIMTNCNANFRKPDHPVIKKFPRAVLGLPIGFKFKDEDKNDPYETILEGREKSGNRSAITRLASPLILRPILCSDGAIGLALVLTSPRTPPNGIYLYNKKTRKKINVKPVEVTLTNKEAGQIPPIDNQLSKLGNISDNDPDLILKAFLKQIEE